MTFKTQEEIKQEWAKDDQEHAEEVFRFCRRMTRRQRKGIRCNSPRSPKRKELWVKLYPHYRIHKLVRVMTAFVLERLNQPSFASMILPAIEVSKMGAEIEKTP